MSALQGKRGDPCAGGCGKVGYYKLGRCTDCLKGKCSSCHEVKVLRNRDVCSDCHRRKTKKIKSSD